MSKKCCIIWKLVCLAVCWLVWLEHNKRVFEGCLERAFNVFCRAKEVACLWDLRCKHLGEFLVVSTLRGWVYNFHV